MKAQRTKRGTTGGWAAEMRLKKLKAARAKWLEKQQATRSDYARQEATRRFVILVDGRLHGETTDHDQAMHVQQLLRGDGQKNVTVESDGQPGDVASISCTAINCKFRLPGTGKL